MFSHSSIQKVCNTAPILPDYMLNSYSSSINLVGSDVLRNVTPLFHSQFSFLFFDQFESINDQTKVNLQLFLAEATSKHLVQSI